MRKNKSFNPNNCPVTHALNKMGGKWKPVVIYLIRNGCNRFGALQRAIPEISKQMLTQQLRELEEDLILNRTIFAEIPPRVEYTLTSYGETLFPVIDALSEWGRKDMEITTQQITPQ